MPLQTNAQIAMLPLSPSIWFLISKADRAKSSLVGIIP